jgi:hypothetical protein
LTPAEYKQTELKKFRLALGFRVRAPLGQYNPETLVNLGMNRWAFKTVLGGGWQLKKMLFELKAVAWFFTPNYDFYGDNILRQQPVLAGQFHWSYVFKKGLWISASCEFYGFGAISIYGSEYKNPLENTRFGVALAIPITKGHALKIAYNAGTSTRFGANFNTFILAYQFMWMKKQ